MSRSSIQQDSEGRVGIGGQFQSAEVCRRCLPYLWASSQKRGLYLFTFVDAGAWGKCDRCNRWPRRMTEVLLGNGRDDEEELAEYIEGVDVA